MNNVNRLIILIFSNLYYKQYFLQFVIGMVEGQTTWSKLQSSQIHYSPLTLSLKFNIKSHVSKGKIISY